MTNKNNVKICAITGEEEPEVGSTAVAILRPDDAAIFSPAKEAAAKKIVRISPADNPIAISVTAITTPWKDAIKVIFGNVGFNDTTMKVKATLMSILIGRITNLAPNKGDASRNVPILRVANRNCAINSIRFWRFKPGKAPTPSLTNPNIILTYASYSFKN